LKPKSIGYCKKKRRKEMNKNVKKVVVSLLSVLMVLSFMPAMAFAGTITPDDPTDHDYEEVEVLQEPDCKTGTIGLARYKCTGNDTYDLECSAEYVDWKYPEHTYTTEIRTKDEILLAALENYLIDHSPLSTAALTNLYNNYKNRCRGIVPVCENCGLMRVTLRHYYGNVYRIIDSETGAGLGDDWIDQHSTCTIPCAETYECEFCGATLDGPNAAKDETKHKYEQVKRTENICGGLTILEEKCTECGKERTTVTGGPAVHEGIEKVAAPTTPEQADALVRYNGDWYKPNYEVKPATCAETGLAGLKCTKCGLVLVDATAGGNKLATVAKKAHTKVVEKIPATCYHEDIEMTVCSECGEVFESIYTGKKLDHDYKVETIFEPNCYADGIILISCTKCGRVTVVDGSHIEDREKVHYFKGWNDELYDAASATPFAKCIVVPDWEQKDHDFGTYEKLADPTCEFPELQARKCAVDGEWNVHDIKEVGKALGHEVKTNTVAPTCGTPGYSYNTCDRCGKIQYGKSGSWYELEPDETPAEYGYDIVDPLVRPGAECTFVWTVTKVPTATEDGEKALVCSNCGTVKAGSETVVPKDSDEAKDIAIEAATPAIEAAANVISDKASYTADSVKAVEEAKAILNQAIASGDAADVTRAAANLQKAVDAAQKKEANTMTAKGKTVKAKAKKTTKISAKKAFKVSDAEGKVTYKKAKGTGKVKVAKTGKVTVKKGLKAGKTYKIKVKVTAAGNDNFLKATKTVTLKVKVK
jgi:hypothetical protein